MIKTYRYRLFPTSKQRRCFEEQASMCRYVFNWGLDRKQSYYSKTGKTLKNSALDLELNQMKKEPNTQWLQQGHAQTLQQSLRDLDRAYHGFFQGIRTFPRFKSKRSSLPTFRIPQKVQVQHCKLRVPKIGWVKIRQSQEVIGKTKSATFKRDTLGHWYVTLVTEFDGPHMVTLATDALGIDLGLKDFVVTSTGERVAAPQIYRTTQRNLRRDQKSLSRAQEGSKNRIRAKLRLAKVHAKIHNQRQDFHHKLSTRLVSTNQAIAVENLSVKGLARTKLAKSVHDAGWSEFVRQLEYKCLWAGKPFTKIDRFYPSSKMCHQCGAVNKNLQLEDREWICGCGSQVDRDLNAALNIRQEGLRILVAAGHAETLNDCGDGVRLSA